MTRRPLGRVGAVLLWLPVVGLATASGMGFAGDWDWRLDLFAHFRFQYAAVALILTLAALLLRRWVGVVVAIAILAANAWQVAPLYFTPISPTLPPGVPTLRLAHANVRVSNPDREAVARFIADSDADVVFLQEVDERWLAALAERDLAYDVFAGRPRPDNFGLAMLVRTPPRDHVEVVSVTVRDVTDGVAQVPAIAARLRLAGQDVAVLSLHTLPPVSRLYAETRDIQLDAAARWARAIDGPCAVIGDLNATPWSHAFERLLVAGDLTNTQRGYGLSGTWPTGLSWTGMIPIDHCLVRGLTAVDRRVGPDIGSDHRPLLVELTVAP